MGFSTSVSIQQAALQPASPSSSAFFVANLHLGSEKTNAILKDLGSVIAAHAAAEVNALSDREVLERYDLEKNLPAFRAMCQQGLLSAERVEQLAATFEREQFRKQCEPLSFMQLMDGDQLDRVLECFSKEELREKFEAQCRSLKAPVDLAAVPEKITTKRGAVSPAFGFPRALTRTDNLQLSAQHCFLKVETFREENSEKSFSQLMGEGDHPIDFGDLLDFFTVDELRVKFEQQFGHLLKEATESESAQRYALRQILRKLPSFTIFDSLEGHRVLDYRAFFLTDVWKAESDASRMRQERIVEVFDSSDRPTRYTFGIREAICETEFGGHMICWNDENGPWSLLH